MKPRTRARSLALQVLYEVDMANHPPGDVFKLRLEEFPLTDDLAEFARQIIFGILPLTQELDLLIAKYAPDWPLDQIAAIDRNNLDFPVESTREQPAMGRKVDLDLGGGNIELPGSPTEELAVPDLEPVTLSEVGTKLDLARAYLDMGDPDGARSMLQEVLSEGSTAQQDEARKLLTELG